MVHALGFEPRIYRLRVDGIEPAMLSVRRSSLLTQLVKRRKHNRQPVDERCSACD